MLTVTDVNPSNLILMHDWKSRLITNNNSRSLILCFIYDVSIIIILEECNKSTCGVERKIQMMRNRHDVHDPIDRNREFLPLSDNNY